MPRLAALGLSVVALWFLTGWTVLASSTAYGFPGRATASAPLDGAGRRPTPTSPPR